MLKYSPYYPLPLSLLEESLVHLIHPAQHGFRSGNSMSTNLVEFEAVIEGMSSVGQVNAAYADFSKAFHHLDHSILSTKLEENGV